MNQDNKYTSFLTRPIQGFMRFYLYGNIHISLCAALFTWYAYDMLGLEVNYFYLGFITSGTLSLYALHRVIGVDRMMSKNIFGRFAIILTYRKILLLLAILGGTTSFICYYYLPTRDKILLIIPGLIALFYILPLFGNRRRMRDLPLIKIFMIAIVWAYLTAYIPSLHDRTDNYISTLLFASRALFVFSITIPFDIRDYHIDMKGNVPTLVHNLGIRYSKLFGICALSIALWIIIFVVRYYTFSIHYIWVEIIVHVIAAALILGSRKDRQDTYFTFWLDGILMLFFFISYMMKLFKNILLIDSPLWITM